MGLKFLFRKILADVRSNMKPTSILWTPKKGGLQTMESRTIKLLPNRKDEDEGKEGRSVF